MQISAKGLTFTYNAKSALSAHALRGVDVTVPSGSFFLPKGKYCLFNSGICRLDVFDLLARDLGK